MILSVGNVSVVQRGGMKEDLPTQCELKQAVIEFFSNRTSQKFYQLSGDHDLFVAIHSNQRQGARLNTVASPQKTNAFDSPAVSGSLGSSYTVNGMKQS